LADLSTHGANRILTWLMTGSNVARPAHIRAALFTSPTQEVSGNGYARQAITFSNGNNRGTSNTATANFTATGGGWGTITHVGLYDAQTGGNLLWQGAVSGGGKLIENGDVLVLQAGAVTITLN